jgi:hypothetical protein
MGSTKVGIGLDRGGALVGSAAPHFVPSNMASCQAECCHEAAHASAWAWGCPRTKGVLQRRWEKALSNAFAMNDAVKIAPMVTHSPR